MKKITNFLGNIVLSSIDKSNSDWKEIVGQKVAEIVFGNYRDMILDIDEVEFALHEDCSTVEGEKIIHRYNDLGSIVMRRAVGQKENSGMVYCFSEAYVAMTDENEIDYLLESFFEVEVNFYDDEIEEKVLA